MVLGALLLCWRDRSASWPWGVVIAAITLLILAVFWPGGYAPVDRALKFLQALTVQAFSWAVLLVVFLFIFIPGRWILRSRSRAVFCREKMDTYWIDRPASSDTRDFQRQF